jgi:tRNA-specific 2-thiouridylase
VDSSVTAALLKREGYDVIGISLQLHDKAENIENEFGTCCSLGDLHDARRVAEKIGIPFYVTNMEDEFHGTVIDDFVSEYLQGRTPNPCVRCNEKVKFSRLLEWALDLGADYLATGHYARVVEDSHGLSLTKGLDPSKDQSYFLFTLKPQELAHTIFPVGHLEKSEVRALAHELGLAVANKPDSQEICFVAGKTYAGFVEEKAPEKIFPGDIVDRDGKVLGQHRGIHAYTIGQRKGLGVFGPDPLFVLAIDPEKNQVVVGPEAALFRKEATIAQVNWLKTPNGGNYHAKIRYRAKESPVRLELLGDDRARVEFLEPQRAVTPGQVLVLYEEDRVIGGGWIESLSL